MENIKNGSRINRVFSIIETKIITFFSNYTNKYNFLFISLIIISFLSILILNLQNGMFHDDFGNAALAYKYVVPNVSGTKYSFSQLFEWNSWIYQNWGGRVVYGGILVLLLKNGITVFMVLQTFVIEGIFVYIYLISTFQMKKRIINFLIFIGINVFYYLLGITYNFEGVYWASASILYIWPMLFVFMYIYHLLIYNNLDLNNVNKINKRVFYIIIIFSLLMASISQEQISVATFGIVTIWILFDRFIMKKKRDTTLDIIMISISFLGLMFVLLSPGNFVRLDTTVENNLSFFEKIYFNMPKVFNAITKESKSLSIYNFFLVLVICFVLYDCVIFYNNNPKKYNIIFLLLTIIFFICCSIALVSKNNKLLFIVYSYIVFYFLVISFFDYLIKKDILYFILPSLMVMIEFSLLASPSVGGRTTIPYLFSLFLYISFMISKRVISNTKKVNIVYVSLIISIFPVISSYQNVYLNFSENKKVFDLNEKILRNIHPENGNVYLFKYPNLYGGVEPYDYGYYYVNDYIKEYYDISSNTNLIWLDNNKYTLKNLTNDFYSTLHVYGLYDYEENVGWWMQKNCAFYFESGRTKKITISFYNPFDFIVEGELFINGDSIKISVKNNEFKSYEIDTKDGINLIEIKNNISNSDNDNNDIRELSLLISKVEIC